MESDEENDFEGLFAVRDSIDEVVIFESIIIDFQHEESIKNQRQFGVLITFTYSYCHETFFHSKLFLPNIHHFPSSFTNWKMTVYSIGMVILTWYWMGFASKTVVLSKSLLQFVSPDEENIKYWHEFYRNILAEFIYENKLSFTAVEIVLEDLDNDSDHFLTSSQSILSSEQSEEVKPSVIVPLGGGKDSLVVWHMLQEAGEVPLLVYVADGFAEFEDHQRLSNIVQLTNSPLQLVKHDFAYPEIGDHCKSYCIPCGHPWAALVMFDNVLMAGIYGINKISVGYEQSADEGNGVFVGELEVNHQYDKSSPFVSLSNRYIHQFIDAEIVVESKLCKMWEIDIMKIFCEQLQPFHPLFISCNDPVTETSAWCLKCEKCAFIYLLLASYLSIPYISDVVFPGRENMLTNPQLTKLFLSLVGHSVHDGKKPFDCIGTKEEIALAMKMSIWQYHKNYLHQYKQLYSSNQEGEDEREIHFDDEQIAQSVPCNLQALTTYFNIPITPLFQYNCIEELVAAENRFDS